MNKRASNFELLRVVAMLMIIAFHITDHCIKVQLSDTTLIDTMGNGLFSHPLFYKKLFLIAGIMPFGKAGNTIFILITGYFLIEKDSINIAKITRKLLLQLSYAVVILMITSLLIHIVAPSYSIKMISVNNFNTQSWFVGYYFIIVFVAFLGLNKFLSRLTRRDYQTLLIVLFGMISIGWVGNLINNFADTLRIVVTGIFIYSLGGYCKLFDPFAKIKRRTIVYVIALIIALVYTSFYISTNNRILDYNNSNENSFTQVIDGYSDYHVVPLALGICLFELARRIKIRNYRIINYFGEATFTIYLLHDNQFVYSLWNLHDWISCLYYRPFLYLVELVCWSLCTFAIGLIGHNGFKLSKKLITRLQVRVGPKIGKDNEDDKD